MDKNIFELMMGLYGVNGFAVLVYLSIDGILGTAMAMGFSVFFTYKVIEAYSTSSGIKSE